MAEGRVERRLAAILAADVAGYSRMMGADEIGTLAALKAHRRELIDPKIAEHNGRIVKTTGDGMLVEFASVVEAVRCAVEVNEAMAKRNADVPEEKRIEFRVGINVGDIIIDEGDIHGDGVNIAARLEGIAQPGSIFLSKAARDQVRDKLDMAIEDMGEQRLKNIARPVHVYRLGAGFIRSKVTEKRPALALPDKPSIAVLPFQNMSGDPEQEYFADGMVEEIITALSRFRQLFVIARNSSFTYKGRAADVKQVGRELGVRYVLEGSVRKASARVRITGQLIDASTGANLWADRFDGGLEDIFELQDRVTASVVGAIAPKLEQVEIERAQRKPTDSLDAYDCFLRGIATFHQYVERQQAALRLFYRATELDPNYASAYAMAAFCYTVRKQFGWRTDPARESAEAVRLARRAMDLAKDDAQALALSGLVLAHSGRDLDSGVALIDRALTLNPNLATAWYFRSWPKIWLGEPEAAIESIERAMRLSPLDAFRARMQNGMAHAHFFAGRYEEASSWAAMALRELPDFHDALRISAASNALAGRLKEAREATERLRQLDPDLRISKLGELQGPYRHSGDVALYENALRKSGLPE
jgi:adenylate cyclase